MLVVTSKVLLVPLLEHLHLVCRCQGIRNARDPRVDTVHLSVASQRTMKKCLVYNVA